MNPFTQKAVNIIHEIPPGKVMTYGQIAAFAGSPRGARQVVRILHSLSEKHHLPWHRVINVRGEIGFKDEESFLTQKSLLETEGVIFKNNNTVDLEKHLWQPDMNENFDDVM
ncbi:MGMT family protein [Fictibacillus aquaticus]|uniref:DNA methyltransferase n=1 Tax=Fictibacillus aquaticus TaxID=2021314 RepID=A0A235FD90_9BACL|nr:MGMT family protein [Fictibacillus aquaticus]OYD59318.1 DNA methyltransferase [Fictibacillus aquaticus]